jgi:hypothetical protein
VTQDLVAFMSSMKKINSFRSYLYWKMIFGVMDGIATNYFPAEENFTNSYWWNSREGMNTRLRKKITNN